MAADNAKTLSDYQVYDLLNRPGPLWRTGLDLGGLDLRRVNLSKADLLSTNLSKANLLGLAWAEPT